MWASLARRHLGLGQEARTLGKELDRLTAQAAPESLALFGAGPYTVGALLLAAGDNPERLRSEAAFAMLCGPSPIEASSGKTRRHRLNRSGDRKANEALWRIELDPVPWTPKSGAKKSWLVDATSAGSTSADAVKAKVRVAR